MQIKKYVVIFQPILDESTASDISDLLDDMDEYLDEALGEDSEGPTPPKHGKRTPPVSYF